MKLSKFIVSLIIFVLFLSGCQGIKESLTNKKKNNSNEFLVEKKDPLVLPPDFEKLPKPQDETKKEIDESNVIDLSKILKKTDKKKIKKNKNQNNSLEKSISKILNKN